MDRPLLNILMPITKGLLFTLRIKQALHHLPCLPPTLDACLAFPYNLMPNIQAQHHHRYSSNHGSSTIHRQYPPSPSKSRHRHLISWTSR